MSVVYFIISFIFGAILGSFMNVFVLRYRTGRSIGGRSACAACSAQLTWYELIPIVSYLMQRGRCRSCGSRISRQYPIVELLTAVMFVLGVYAVLGPAYIITPMLIGKLIYTWVVLFLLLALAVYDIKHMIIPNGMVYALMVVTFVWGFIQPDVQLTTYNVQHMIAGPVVALPLFALWWGSRGQWMGFGDVKLACAMGWLLGMLGGISAVIFGIWIGAIISLASIGVGYLVSRGKHLTMKSMIPFGPFLVAGTILVLITGLTLDMLLYV